MSFGDLPNSALASDAQAFFESLQAEICAGLAAADGRAQFREDRWERGGGGGGLSRVLESGGVFEKAGVNFSAVHGQFTPEFIASQGQHLPGDGLDFFATGVSLVLHPRNPFVPTTHANFRFLRRGQACWFGGGADLTPFYPEREDVVHFHRTWKQVCDRHDAEFYPRFKKWCDEYFYLPHRDETRGIGGIFFDQLMRSAKRDFVFVQDAGRTFLSSYLPIVERRKDTPFGERERNFQLVRRGRYAEFNLLYDRGTIFGLKTDGRAESILMSLPPLVRWDYCPSYPADSREADLPNWLCAQNWL